MLPDDVAGLRGAGEPELVAALAARQPLALAEAYRRTAAAAHAVARRLLGRARLVEAVLCTAYADLWAQPPAAVSLERWARARCFELGSAHLAQFGEPAASPSAASMLPGTSAAAAATPAEAAIAGLGEQERTALLLAHDQGVPTAQQPVGDASAALRAALETLAGPPTRSRPAANHPDAAVSGPLGRLGLSGLLGDRVLGLLEPDAAARVDAALTSNPECAALARTLRRGRRTIEGMPPPPDTGPLVVAWVLSSSPAKTPTPADEPAGAESSTSEEPDHSADHPPLQFADLLADDEGGLDLRAVTGLAGQGGGPGAEPRPASGSEGARASGERGSRPIPWTLRAPGDGV